MLLGTVVAVQAEPADESKSETASDAAVALSAGGQVASATIERIMDQAVRNIAARYNLNTSQTDYTKQLMQDEVHRFLKEHENEIWPVIHDLINAQFGGKPPDNLDETMRIGKAARPLAKLAKEAIFEANWEWRAILTPDQQKVHDFDMAEMETTFEKMDANLGTWEAGQPTDRGIFPRPQVESRQPPRPRKPPKVQPELRIFDPNPILEALVEEFLKEYKLDEGQITSVRSILEEFKGQAGDYLTSKKTELSAAAAEREDALKRRSREDVKKAAKVHKKLLVPIYQLCEQMQDRLTSLLTTAQRQQHAENNKSTADTSKQSAVRKKALPGKTAPRSTGSANSDSPASSDDE